MKNRFPGTCWLCGTEIGAGMATPEYRNGRWNLQCPRHCAAPGQRPLAQPRYVGYCQCGRVVSQVIHHYVVGTVCDRCGEHIDLRRVVGTHSDDSVCNDECLSARGAVCVCGCGGANHGILSDNSELEGASR